MKQEGGIVAEAECFLWNVYWRLPQRTLCSTR